MEKAFDRIGHEALLYKMINCNCPKYVIYIISSFLKNRTFQVVVNGKKSGTMNYADDTVIIAFSRHKLESNRALVHSGR